MNEAMIWQSVDGVAFRMARPYDFSFLAQVGQVFRVFDDQDSGNLCFGVRKGEERFFVKFAGAPTVRAGCLPEEAVAALRASVPLYRDLAHESLIRLRDARAVDGGYLAVFDWVDAVCMGKMYPQDRARFFELPLPVRRGIWVDILRFLIHVHERGYVAVDFYDGSVLYDPVQGKTLLCDIDLFQKKPYCNPMGRLWGSSRFMSPEEFTLGDMKEPTSIPPGPWALPCWAEKPTAGARRGRRMRNSFPLRSAQFIPTAPRAGPPCAPCWRPYLK